MYCKNQIFTVLVLCLFFILVFGSAVPFLPGSESETEGPPADPSAPGAAETFPADSKDAEPGLLAQEEENPNDSIPDPDPTVQGEEDQVESALPLELRALIHADYYIDFANGTIPLGILPLGALVVDPSWDWEFRLGVNHSDIGRGGDPTPPGEVKPVTWIVVAKDHYAGLEPHVTLLSKEVIARACFDNRTDRHHPDSKHFGYNHWGESGSETFTFGLRPWLNSTGNFSREGFFRAFPDDFSSTVLTTPVPNREWENGVAYSTNDKVFIPSATELGDTGHNYTYPIGTLFPYFQGTDNAKRIATLGGEERWYWTRSPGSDDDRHVRGFTAHGATHGQYADLILGVRPVVNLKADSLVSVYVKLTPAEVLELFYSAVFVSNWDEVKKWTVPEMHWEISMFEGSEVDLARNVTNYQVNAMEQIDGNNISVEIINLMEDGTREESRLTMVNKDGKWLVSSW